MSSSFELGAWLESWRDGLAATLHERIAATWPTAFGEALSYPLFTGGKRVRPALVIASWEALGTDPSEVAITFPAAAAVELVHTYSLVHDDLPCMDDDDERRGRPTVHKAYDEQTAVLVGDALLTEAFSTLAAGKWPAETTTTLVRSLANAAGHRGMVGGQAADVGLDGPVVDRATLERLHRMKTGALITWASMAGGIIANATAPQRASLETYGHCVGLAFQLIDDLLDADEDVTDGGPPSFVRLLGEPETRRLAHAQIVQAQAAISNFPRPDALSAIARFVVERDH